VFASNGFPEIGARSLGIFYGLHEPIKSLKSIHFVRISDLGCFQRASQQVYGFVIGFERNREWVAVLAAKGEIKRCRIRKPRGCSVDDFCNKGQRLKSSRTKLL
jgi:hypothetical protein